MRTVRPGRRVDGPNRARLTAIAVVLLLGLPAVTQAQSAEVGRQRFTFLEHDLRIEVRTAAAGSLRIIRGEAGLIDAAGSAMPGFVAFGLERDGRARLSLTTAARTEQVDYIVIVPRDVRIEVQLPGRRESELVGTLQSDASFEWKSPDP